MPKALPLKQVLQVLPTLQVLQVLPRVELEVLGPVAELVRHPPDHLEEGGHLHLAPPGPHLQVRGQTSLAQLIGHTHLDRVKVRGQEEEKAPSRASSRGAGRAQTRPRGSSR